MRIILTSIFLGILPPAAVDSAQSAETARRGRLSFGWAGESITPSKPVAIGGQYHTRISANVHDPLTVTALALETRDDAGVIAQAVWVSCDLVGIRAGSVANIRKLAAEALPDLDAKKILVSATHTHTAPAIFDVTDPPAHPYDFMGSFAYRIPAGQQDLMHPKEFLAFFEHQAAAAVIAAWKSRQPGEVGSALGHASVARNRRAVFFDGTTRMYGSTADPGFSHTEGTSEDSLDVLLFRRDGKLTGMALTIYCPSQEMEGETYLSADFWHDTRKLLRERFGPDLQVLPLCGASGDQSPHLQVGKQTEADMLARRKLEYRQEIARRIADAVGDVADLAGSTARGDVLLEHRVETIPLPVWKVSDARLAEAVAAFEAGKDRLDQLSPVDYINWRVSRTMIARHHLQKTEPSYQAEIHALRLNDLALITNPFELFTDYCMRIKARSPATQTSVVQLTADSPGYLPTERAVQGGGYSARIDDGVVGPEGGRVLVEEAVRMLKSLWEAPK
ncbi:MAG: hypothetical protein KA004_06585 [Verrucomicrobiales bacterium]|nr:hypothetical protein [Verrucomicrobiales bacterium]